MANGIDIGSFTGSSFKGDDAIKKIMESEEKQKIPVQNEKFRLQMQKQAWSILQQKLSDLATATRDMTSPAYSAFRKIKTTSSSPDLITLSSDGIDPNHWNPGSYKVIPKQMANSDHFQSDSQDAKASFGASNFTVLSNGKSYNISFGGGTLDDLVKILNTTAGDILDASLVNGDNGEYIDIQGKITGKKGRIDFKGDTKLLESLGLITPAEPSYFDAQILSSKGLSGNRSAEEFLAEGSLKLKKGDLATKKLPIPQDITSSDTELWIYLKKDPNESSDNSPATPKETAPQTKPNDFITGFRDKVWVGDVDLAGGEIYNPEMFVEPKEPITEPSPSLPPSSEALTLSITYADGKKTQTILPWSSQTNELQILKKQIPQGKVISIALTNIGSSTALIQKVQIVNPRKGEWDHKNSLTEAQNAIVNYKGIDYEKESNTITDLIPGTINLLGTSDKAVNLALDYDVDALLEQIKEWITAYNNTMDYIKNTTKQDFSLISRINRDRNQEMTDKRIAYEKLSSDEKDKMALNGSLFEGFLASDSMIDMLKTKLQSFTKTVYKTDLKEKLMLLSQLGIAVPNAAQLTEMSDEEKENYRAGYLDFSKQGQEEFVNLLNQSASAVQQFFFQRINNSKLYNAGMFIDYDKLLSLYLQRYSGKNPGFFLAKSQLLDSQIQNQNKKLSDLENKMKQDENKLRNDFAKVYNAQNRSKAMEEQLSRFGKGGN